MCEAICNERVLLAWNISLKYLNLKIKWIDTIIFKYIYYHDVFL